MLVLGNLFFAKKILTRVNFVKQWCSLNVDNFYTLKKFLIEKYY